MTAELRVPCVCGRRIHEAFGLVDDVRISPKCFSRSILYGRYMGDFFLAPLDGGSRAGIAFVAL